MVEGMTDVARDNQTHYHPITITETAPPHGEPQRVARTVEKCVCKYVLVHRHLDRSHAVSELKINFLYYIHRHTLADLSQPHADKHGAAIM